MTDRIDHTSCSHPSSAEARRTCRDVQQITALAREWGLSVRDTSDAAVAQVSFIEPDDRWYSTRVVWTRHYQASTFGFEVVQSTKITKTRGRLHLLSWLKTIAGQP